MGQSKDCPFLCSTQSLFRVFNNKISLELCEMRQLLINIKFKTLTKRVGSVQNLVNSVKMMQQKGGVMKITRLLGILVFLLALSSCRSVVAPEFHLDPIVTQVKSKDLDFSELLDKSDLVVKVKVVDKLDLTNSNIESEKEFHALRHLEILEVLEDNIDLKDDVKVITLMEAAAINTENVYYTSNHMPLVQDEEYVLFLSLRQDGQYEILDGDNGVVNIKNITSNQNVEVMVNTLFKYFKPEINGKSIDYVKVNLVDQQKNVKFDRYTIKLQDIEIPVRLGQNKSTKKEYLMISTLTFELDEPILSKIK